MATHSQLNGVDNHSEPKARKTRTAKAAEHVSGNDEARKMGVLGRYLEAQEEMLKEFGVPTSRRAMAAFATSLCVAGAVGIAGAFVIDLVVTGAVMLTGSAFIAMVAWLIGYVATIVLGVHLAGKAYAYVASRKVDEHFTAAKSWFSSAKDNVSSMFTRKPASATVH